MATIIEPSMGVLTEPEDIQNVTEAAALAPTFEVQDMIDTTHANAHNIPVTTAVVGGYDTGSPDIIWVEADWERLAHSTHIHINQQNAFEPLLGNVFDIEAGAWTIEAAAEACKMRQEHNRLCNLYLSAGLRDVFPEGFNVHALRIALAVAGIKKAYIWAADWNLSRAEAISHLDNIDGEPYPVVNIQWASPSSNPNLIVPGSHLTLREANVDLSVGLDLWFDLFEHHVTPTLHATVEIPSQVLKIQSTDGGKTWTVEK